jgi:hypothetical protein
MMSLRAGFLRAAVLGGCATTPRWVESGTGAVSNGSRILQGVGEADPAIKNKALAKSTAENRARFEIMGLVERLNATAMRELTERAAELPTPAEGEGQHVAADLRTYADEVLSSVELTDYWTSSEGAVFARASLRVEVFSEAMSVLEHLDPERKRIFLEAIDRTFAEIVSEGASSPPSRGQPP